jgi:hypothetical protein
MMLYALNKTINEMHQQQPTVRWRWDVDDENGIIVKNLLLLIIPESNQFIRPDRESSYRYYCRSVLLLVWEDDPMNHERF